MLPEKDVTLPGFDTGFVCHGGDLIMEEVVDHVGESYYEVMALLALDLLALSEVLGTFSSEVVPNL